MCSENVEGLGGYVEMVGHKFPGPDTRRHCCPALAEEWGWMSFDGLVGEEDLHWTNVWG